MSPLHQRISLWEEAAGTALAAAEAGFWAIDVPSSTTTWDDGFCRVMGLDPVDVDGESPPWQGLLDEDVVARVTEAVESCARGEQTSLHLEYPIRRPDGGRGWIESRGRVVEWGCGGEPLRIVGTVRDITPRKEAERARVESEARLRSFIDSTQDAVWCFECAEPIPVDIEPEQQFERMLESRLVECNLVYARVRGVERPEELYGKAMSELIREDMSAARHLYLKVAASGYNLCGEIVTLHTPQGPRRVEVRATLTVENGHLLRLWGSMADVTEREEALRSKWALEQKLAQVQRMDGIGALAGGIAHDFNNMLLAIAGEAELAMRDLGKGRLERVVASLHEIRVATDRAAEMTRRLLRFSRRDALEPEHLEPIVVVRELVPMLRRLLPASIELRVEAEPLPAEAQRPEVLADRTSIEQVLVNLVINARDAIGETGTIEIHVGTSEVDSTRVAGYPWARPGPHVCIEVRDDGAGIAPELLPRIFEPFFTTKSAVEGTGLGLSVVYGILRQHGGFVEVTSRPSEGTCLRVLLPEAHEDAWSGAEPSVVDADRDASSEIRVLHETGGGRRVLLAEDNPMVRRAVGRMLSSAGYEVHQAVDGAEAIDIIERRELRFDAAVVDAVMPGRSGRDVFDVLRRHQPDVPVVFASGYGAEVMDRARAERLGCAFLTKPFDRMQLLVALDGALARRERVG